MFGGAQVEKYCSMQRLPFEQPPLFGGPKGCPSFDFFAEPSLLVIECHLLSTSIPMGYPTCLKGP